MTILVIGATGRTGQPVVDHLIASGQSVRILCRATSKVPDRWDGIERAIGDLNDVESLFQAMTGAEGLFVLSPMDPLLDRTESNAFDAAVRAGVGHVVKLSTTKPEPDSPIPWWRAHARSEQALRRSGLPWTILRPNGISFFLLEHARGIREQGVLRTAAGDGRMALIDADDIGAVTACVFADPGRYAGEVLDLTGPTAVSYADVADIITSITGRRVTHVDVSPEEGHALLLSYGMLQWEADGILANWLMTRDGSGGFDRVTDQVERISGRHPLSVDVFLTAQKDAFATTR
jgi:NAD(P)H dehydrogenase (quinone)